jgi:hypothetical protein
MNQHYQNTMLKVLTLEDTRIGQEILYSSLNKLNGHVSHHLVKDSREFRDYVSSGLPIEHAFLDDMVPDIDGRMKPMFMLHHSMLIQAHPTAKVYYRGSMPGMLDELYCAKNDIEIIEKYDVAKIVRQILIQQTNGTIL